MIGDRPESCRPHNNGDTDHCTPFFITNHPDCAAITTISTRPEPCAELLELT
jgi:hypothetical protein